MGRLRSERAPVRLGKTTSNLFRFRAGQGVRKLDVRGLNRVIDVDAEAGIVDVEGMTPYDTLVDNTLDFDLLPAVTPELKSITIGGAVSGIGIESSSFRFGLVHENIDAMEVLLADGRVVPCSRAENPDLFFGLPNSYGTLGYILRLRARTIPARPYVHLTHVLFDDPDAFFAAIAERCERAEQDFLDGTVFGRGELYLTEGRFSDEAPRVSNYKWMEIYYASIRRKTQDWLTARDYIWRWDTDWFWCSKNCYAQNPLIRLLAGPRGLNSRSYQRVMRLAQRFLPDYGGTESVIQDVDVEIGRAAEFLDFLLAEIGITPIWICPLRPSLEGDSYPLYRLDPRKAYVNFGFWDVIPSGQQPGYFNRKVENKLLELGGKKGLYSSVWFDEDTFWSIYNKPCYAALKSKYDPEYFLGDLYHKCVRSSLA